MTLAKPNAEMALMVKLRDVFTRQTRLFRASEIDIVGVPAKHLFKEIAIAAGSISCSLAFERFESLGSEHMNDEQKRDAASYMQTPLRKFVNSEFVNDVERPAILRLLSYERAANNIESLYPYYNTIKSRIEASDKTFSYIAEDKNQARKHANTYVEETPEEIFEAVANTQAEILAKAMKLAR